MSRLRRKTARGLRALTDLATPWAIHVDATRPPAACEPLGVEAIHPDEFLLDLHDLNPEAVRAALEQQPADLNPPWPLDELLRALTAAGVPRFADAIRARR